jgi:hypothetical protein
MRHTVRASLFPDVSFPNAEEDEDRRQVRADGFPPRPADDGRRVGARQRVLLSAIIVDLDSETFLRCRLENVSDAGARLRLSEPRFLPPKFWFVAITSGLAFEATTAWRRDERVGVSVGAPSDLNDPRNGLERRLRRMWLLAR